MSRIQVRRGTSVEWADANPVLHEGEFGLETNTGKLKLGNGLTHWVDLSYLSLDWATLAGKPAVLAAGATAADARDAIDAEYTGNKGQPDGYASLDAEGLVPQAQLPITTSDWATLEGKPAVVAAGATKAEARAAIDAAALDENGYIPLEQWGPQVLDAGGATTSATTVIDGGTA